MYSIRLDANSSNAFGGISPAGMTSIVLDRTPSWITSLAEFMPTKRLDNPLLDFKLNRLAIVGSRISHSINSTFLPASAMVYARLIAVILFPSPFTELVIPIIFCSSSSVKEKVRLVRNSLYASDAAKLRLLPIILCCSDATSANNFWFCFFLLQNIILFPFRFASDTH